MNYDEADNEFNPLFTGLSELGVHLNVVSREKMFPKLSATSEL